MTIYTRILYLNDCTELLTLSRAVTIFLTIIVISLISLPAFAGAANEIIMNSTISDMKKAGIGHVVYPHKLHETIYKCNDCHPKVFIEKAGANKITMQKNIEEQYCGSSGCHNSPYAFPLYFCDSCHIAKSKE